MKTLLMKILINIQIILVIIIKVFFVNAFSQNTEKNKNWNIHFTTLSTLSKTNIPEKFDRTVPKGDDYPSRTFYHSITFLKNKNAIELKYNGAKPLTTLPSFGTSLWPNNEFYEVSLMYNRYFFIPNHYCPKYF